MTKKEKRAYDQIYYATNKEKRRAYRQAYYKANKEKWEIYNNEVNQKAWREAHPGYHKAYEKANPEKRKLARKVFRQRNLDKGREDSRKRRALKRTTQIEPISEKIVYLRDGWICQICKKRVDKRLKYPNPMSASLDHITPLSEGGSHSYKNVQLAHFGCNISKKDSVLPQGEQMRIF